MTGPGWPDARGWIIIASFSLTLIILLMIWLVPSLRQDEFFKSLAVLIVGTGWISGPLAWAFGSTKSGVEMSERNAAFIARQATPPAPSRHASDPAVATVTVSAPAAADVTVDAPPPAVTTPDTAHPQPDPEIEDEPAPKYRTPYGD